MKKVILICLVILFFAASLFGSGMDMDMEMDMDTIAPTTGSISGDALLLETGDALLLESGDKLLLE